MERNHHHHHQHPHRALLPSSSSSASQQQQQQPHQHGVIMQELYFLIAKFLSHGPLAPAAQLIIAALEQQHILPARIDWTGHDHPQSYAELERKYSHIAPAHLLELCARIPRLLEADAQPSVAGIVSLLGAGRQSVLRTAATCVRAKSLRDHCTRWHAQPLAESAQRRPNNNIVHVLLGRQAAGPLLRRLAVPAGFYERMLLLRRTLGHLSAVYCVLFDRSGKYIITGADDLLVKLWSAIDGRLLATFRGASAEITDIAVNLDNTLLAAGSLDRILRVWDLQTAGPVAVLSGHTGMITSVNFCPSPRAELKYLVTTSTDGSVAFWQYGTPRGGRPQFAAKPIQYHEKLRPGQAQMICASFSPGGVFLAAGSADHHVRVYVMAEEGPRRILETEAHSDTVDSIQWAHSGLRFVSGSKDGMAHVWNFEAQQWRPLKLNMSDRLASCPVPEDESRKLKVTMVSWDFSDRWVITAVNDFTIKVWNATTGKLHRVMRGHTDELYVLESHPKDPHVLISAGHDGQLFVWNILEGVSITSFVNNIDGQGHGGVFDAKWSPDGSMIAATDSHGHILMYGFGSGHQRLKMLPKELFFHTDYRPLMRDVNHFVMDEQTQTIPHLMPPPFLVDVDGNPHPPAFQRLVPGRESCSTEQLVPNITMGPEGMEVVDSANNTVSNIDRLIAVLANRQGPAAAAAPAQPAAAAANGAGPAAAAAAAMAAPAVQAADASAPLQQQRPPVAGGVPLLPVNVVIPAFAAGGPVAASPRSVNGSISARVEGVRQSSGNWEREQNYKWIRRTYVRPMQYSRLQALRQATYVAGQQEHEIYKREMRRRPMMINTGNPTSGGAQTLRPAHPKRRPVRQSRAAASQSNATAGGPSAGGSGAAGSSSAGGASTATPAYRTRAVREREHPPSDENSDDHDDPDHIASASSATDSNDSTAQEDMLSGLSSSSGDSDSSDYSDWVANDQPGQALEPPKRSKRKPVQARQFSPPSSPEAATAGTADASAGDHADGVNAGASTSRGSARPTANGTGSRTRRPNGRSTGGRRAPQRVQPIFENGEIPERYRPPEWLSEVIPRKAPYYPQMGDDVYYFRQGHQRYLDAVRTKAVYKVVGASGEPWAQLDLRDSEPVKVIGIKYEIRPPRLCCLKLALLNADGSLTGQSFAIKYHDMPDVLDFIVLAQTYQMAVQRLWTPGDRFRCMIDDSWWTGCIESRTALSAEFPSSLFMCFRTRWDNGEYEAMSPWDMEPIDQSRLPEEVGGQVPVEPEELRATLYQPKSEEWPRGDRDATCRRIVAGLDEVMGLAIADPFLVPVDLNTYPSYAFMVEYPIDLTTIKARFENHFYRRLTSAQFDVRYLATNAEKFNQSNSSIVKHARIITDLCLRIIKDQNEVDVGAVYHQLMDTYVTSDSEAETEVVRGTGGRAASTSAAAAAALASRSAAARPSSAAAAAAAAAATSSSGRRSTRSRPNEDWQTKCRDLLEMIWARDDSTPFREPVDLIEHPDYLASVDTPMDLRTVKEDLLGGNYHTIGEFVNDMRTIFSNSRNYNTNKRSRIYSMTLRLSNLFEAQLKVVTGKSAKRSRPSGSSRPSATNSQSTQAAGGAGGSSSTALTRRGRHTTTAHHTTGDSGSAAAAGASGSGLNNGAGPSGLQHQHANSHHHLHHPATHLRQRIQPPAADSDDDDDSDSEDIDVLFTFRHSAGSASTASTNNVSNASAPAGATTAAAGRLEPQPGPSGVQAARSSRRRVPGHEVHVNGGGGPAATSAGASTARRSQQQQQQPRGRSVRHAAAANRAHNDEEEDDDDDDEEEEEDDDSDSSAASSSAAATSDSDRGHRSRRRKPPRKRTGANRIFSDGEWDSEESYQPTGSRKKAAKLDKRIAGRVAPAVAAAAAAAETARPHALNGGRSTAAPPVATGPSNTARRRLPAATAAAAVAATSDDDEEEDDDDYQAHDDEDVEEEEDDEEEDDDANDVDYNVNRTPKKTATAATTSTQKRGQPRSTGKKTPAAAAAAPTDPLVSSGSDDNGARRRSARKPVQRYESDHSYHLNASAGSAGSHKRRIQLDTDDDDDADDGGSAQPDTEQVDLDEEAHDDDDDDNDDDGNELIETIEVIVTEELSQDSAGRPRRGNRLRTTTQPTRSGESDSEPLVQPTSSSQASASGARPLRSTRSTRSQADDDGNNDDDESDDDQVLSQLSNGYRSRPAAAAAPPSQRNGHDAAGPSRLAGHHESARRPVRSHVQEDHNYGESAPTLASRPGALRRAVALSRHQRNADELDVHPEASDSVAPLISGRLRRRPTPPAAHSSSSQEATQPQQQHHHRTRRATASQEKAGNGSDDSDDDDDDDKPLRFMATASSTASAQPAGGRQQRPQRRPPPAHADDNATAGLGASTARSTRTQKRPYYNEDSDDTAEPQRNHPPTKRLAAMRTDDDGGGGGGAGGAGNGQTDEFDEEDGAPLRRRRPAQRVGSDADEDADVDVGNDDDDDDGEGGDHGDGDGDHDQDDDDDDDDGEPSISVSSRGRVRRITAKARGLFRE